MCVPRTTPLSMCMYTSSDATCSLSWPSSGMRVHMTRQSCCMVVVMEGAGCTYGRQSGALDHDSATLELTCADHIFKTLWLSCGHLIVVESPKSVAGELCQSGVSGREREHGEWL